MAVLAIQSYIPIPAVPPLLRFVLPLAAAWMYSRPALKGRPSKPFLSILLGLAVFAIWVGPDVVAPAWRQSILFNNGIVGHPAGNTPPAAKNDLYFLFIRVVVSVISVPILEELFWRGWLMRWLIGGQDKDFRNIPLGTYAAGAFWITALLFASEHGSFWDVGLVTGVIFNWWMIRTKNLWDLILTHAVTNAALAAYVIYCNQWQYWL